MSAPITDAVRALQGCPRTDQLARQLDDGAHQLAAAAEEVRRLAIPGITIPPEPAPAAAPNPTPIPPAAGAAHVEDKP